MCRRGRREEAKGKRKQEELIFQDLANVKDYQAEAKLTLEGHLEDILEVAYSPGNANYILFLGLA
jgi:hypothetical protein